MNRQTFIFSTLVALALITASKIQAEPSVVETSTNRYLDESAELSQLEKFTNVSWKNTELEAVLAPLERPNQNTSSHGRQASLVETACSAHTADLHDPSLIRRHDVGIVISRLGGYADVYRNQ